jgi:hypothetical protein
MQCSSLSASRRFSNKFSLLQQFALFFPTFFVCSTTARPQFVFMIISQLQIFRASNSIIRLKFCNGKIMQPGNGMANIREYQKDTHKICARGIEENSRWCPFFSEALSRYRGWCPLHTSNFPSIKSHIQFLPPGPRLHVIFRSELIFYGEELLASRPTPKLQGHPLSDIRDCLFSIFAAALHTWRASPQSAT